MQLHTVPGGLKFRKAWFIITQRKLHKTQKKKSYATQALYHYLSLYRCLDTMNSTIHALI
jgi:hypothetical protein